MSAMSNFQINEWFLWNGFVFPSTQIQFVIYKSIVILFQFNSIRTQDLANLADEFES